MKRLVFALMLLMTTGIALAQDQATPEVPFATPPDMVTVVPDANDARASICNASEGVDYAPYVVRPGDTLANLIIGRTTDTVVQVADQNCLDDPGALPVGAVIWLPVQIVSAAAATQAPAAVTPETTGTVEATADASTASIQSFSASAETISNTDEVTLNWSATGSGTYFYSCTIEPCMRPAFSEALPLSGSVSFDGFQSAGTYRYRLDVDGAGGPVTQDVSIQVTCAQDWLGGIGASPRCPEDPARTVYAVWQPFQHGVMIWFSDTQQVEVMTDDGLMVTYVDQFVDGQPDPSEKAPDGLLTPVRGFGLIWEALGGADSPLGWAQAKEVGYDAARQAAGRTSYTTYVAGPGSIVYALTQIPGAEVGYWAQVAW